MNEDRLSNVMEKVRMLVEIDKKNSCSASVRRARLEKIFVAQLFVDPVSCKQSFT